MIGEISYTIFNTAMGWVGILGSVKGLRRTTLPQPSAQKAQQLLGSNDATWAPHLFEDLSQRLKRYFGSHKVAFSDQLDLSGATIFQHQVWLVTRLIPYGETRSYCWVAQQMVRPRSSRAVGQALGKNPLPIIIPCHRVITSQGELGGYSDGLEWKKHLLNLEATSSI